MGRSEVTILSNFLINALKRGNQLRKALIEYQIPNSNGENVKPDLFVYLIDESNPLTYILFEYKQRTVLDIPRIENQYNKYCFVDPSCLNSLVIPVPDKSLPIFINTIFYDTPDGMITQIQKGITFRNNDGILSYITKGPQSRVFQNKKESDDQINFEIIESLISRSRSEKLWKRIVLPVTFKDIEGVEFSDASQRSLRIRSDVSSSIIISHLFTFISQRKRRKLHSIFHVDDLFDHLFSSLKGLIMFGDDEKRAMTKKIDLFLQFVCNVCEKNNLTLLKQSESESMHFIILIKNTDNFVTRMEKIKVKLDKEIKIHMLQKRVPDYY